MPSSSLRRLGRSQRGVVVLALLVLTCWWGSARPADAHAIVLSVTPSDGAVIDAAPDAVEITFNEPVSAQLGGLRVFDDAGERVDRGATRSTDVTIGVDLAPDLGAGTYLISHRVVSADGHPVRGASVFTVDPTGAASGDAPSSLFDVLGDDDDRVWELVAGVGRFLAMAGALAVVGAVAFAVGTGVGVRDRFLGAAAGAGIVGALIALPTQAALATGQGPGSLFQSGVLGAVARDGFGLAAALAVLGLVVAVVTVDRPTRWAHPVALVASLAVVASFPLVGHTRFDDVAVGVVADVAHVGAAAVWTGGLLQLLLHRRRLADAVERTRITARFASMATGAVVVVGAAGVALSWTEVRRLDALWPTTYGRVLLAKVAIVAVIGAIGVHHHFRAVPALAAAPDDPGRLRSMHRTLRLELVGVVLALVATAALVNITPASVDAGIGQIHSEIVVLGDAGSVQVVVDPNQAGENTIHLYLYDPDGRPAEIAEDVGLELTKPADDLGPIVREPFRAGPSHFQWDGGELASAGTWEITVVARIDRFSEERATTSVVVR